MVGDAVGEVGGMGDVLDKGAVHGRGSHEDDVVAQVVVAGSAVHAGAAGDAGFDGDAVAFGE